MGRLDPGVPEDDVKAYFGGFGTVSFMKNMICVYLSLTLPSNCGCKTVVVASIDGCVSDQLHFTVIDFCEPLLLPYR